MSVYSSKQALAFSIVIAVLILSLIGTAAFWPDTPDEVKPTPVVEESSPDKYMDALMRTWAITDVCYDSSSKHYLFKVAPHQHIEGRTDEGWYITTSYKFVDLSNGSAVLVSSTHSEEIWPDVTGLPCKQQAADPTWFKDK